MHPALSITTTSKLLTAKLHQHVANWEHCDLCPLHATRHWVVIGKGTLPCDVLFVGEAPGNSENDTGKPFVGQCGKILDALIKSSVYRLRRTYKIQWEYTYAITNLISCIPVADQYKIRKAGFAFRTPVADEINPCAPRLQEFTQLAAPRAIVLMGHTTQRFGRNTVLSIFPKDRVPPIHEMHHPSHLLRLGGVVSPKYKTWVGELTRFLADLYNNQSKRA